MRPVTVAQHAPRILAVSIAVFLASAASAAEVSTVLEYVSPRPGAQLLPTTSTIILRPHRQFRPSLTGVYVEGARSGVHTGEWIVAEDGATFIFKPHVPFAPGETVSVWADFGGAGRTTFTFTTSKRRAPPQPDRRIEDLFGLSGLAPAAPMAEPAAPSEARAFTPPADFPVATVTTNDNPEPGSIFVSGFTFGSNPSAYGYYLSILDNTGFPVFFRNTTQPSVDFKQQDNGLLTFLTMGNPTFFAMDSTYTVVDSFKAGNGYEADIHEFIMLPNDHSLLMIYDRQIVDMSQVVAGGDTAAVVTGLVLQELDATKNVVFQWRSWDHFQITDATDYDLTLHEIDYAHGNSIEPDLDGHLIISSRHMDEVTKINRQTGDIIWRMGGENNDFTLLADTLWFTHQHSARRLANGNLLIFDNGLLSTPQESRAVEYATDEIGMTATLVWEFRNTPATYGFAMGSVQRLAGGNTVIGWGATNPTVTEVRPDGSKAFEMTLPTGVFSYRAFRHSWSGTAPTPTLWAEVDTVGQSVTLGFTKFGDPDVVKYYVYRGDTLNPTTIVDSTAGNSIAFSDLEIDVAQYFRVTSVDNALAESPFSNQIAVTIPSQTAVWITHFDASIEDGAVRLDWLIGHADELEGFHIYRVHEGSYRRLNDELLPGPSNSFTDRDVTPGHTYTYRLGAVDRDGEFLSEPASITVPQAPLSLEQNAPNPFNPATRIAFFVPQRSRVTLDIYDVSGRRVRALVNGTLDGGRHVIDWDGKDARGRAVTSGVYFYRLHAGKKSISRKMVYLK